MEKTKWQLSCMNALVDGVVVSDFKDDEEAICFAADFEARCYRIDPDGTRTCIFVPGRE